MSEGAPRLQRRKARATLARCRLTIELLHALSAPQVPEDASGARCPTGQARITPGSRLPAKHVIHTVGPVYSRQSREASAALLSSCYQHSIALVSSSLLVLRRMHCV